MNRWTGGKLQDQKGYTLIELMVTVALIGVVATMAVPSFRETLPHIRLKGATRALATDLRFARAEAVARNDIIWVVFGNTGANYTVRQGNDPLVATELMSVDLSEEYTGVSLGYPGVTSRPPDFPAAVPPGAITFNTQMIRLDALGRAMGGGTDASPTSGEIYLTNSRGEVYCVTVLGTSGRVKVYKWMGGAWQS
ncbi:MAG: GspH/FimT family pseudopilin [Nitrospiria bacterium]